MECLFLRQETPWVPPSLELAEEYKKRNIYGEGILDIWNVDITKVADLGIGVPLYFQFIKSAVILMVVCSILSIPVLIFATHGNQIPSLAQDGFGIYKYTFGNIGANTASVNYANSSACTANIPVNNGTCIHFYGYELTSLNASYIVTLMEMLQVLLFFCVVLYLRSVMKTFRLKAERQICSITDYAIMLRGIPPDTTDAQLIGHFSRLYPLDRPDWMGRPPVEACLPVDSFGNTDDVMYYNTWVAEANVHRKIGRFVTAFKEQQNLMIQILRARARMKMYNENTCHADGPNIKRFITAEKEMLHAGSKLDRLTESIAKDKDFKFENDVHIEPASPASRGRSGKSGKSAKSTKSDHHIIADACAAFVVFQYSESMARCIEDYRTFDSFPMTLVTPSELKLRGHTIQVKQAPQPDEMIWENLEVTETQKRMRRLRTSLYTLILLIVSFIAILQTERLSTSFLADVPPLKLCTIDVPALYAGTYSAKGLSLVRPPDALKLGLDASCSAIYSGSFYAVYSATNDFNHPISNYSLNACTAGHGYNITGICPQYPQQVFCPCISTTVTNECSTLACSSHYSQDPSQPEDCSNFKASLIGGCYCTAQLNAIDIFDTGATLSQECRTFLEHYIEARGIVYCVSVITVVINTLLLYLHVYITKKESHASIDREQASLMLKIFLSTYFNLAIVYILVFGSIPSINNPFFSFTYILQGSYTDFNAAWYGSVGSAFIISFILQGLTPILTGAIGYWIFLPYNRHYHLPRALAHKSHQIVMQQDLNHLFVGPEFDITVATAQNLSLFFFAMTYASALPLLMPLSASLLFLSYTTDKFLICRYYRRPRM